MASFVLFLVLVLACFGHAGGGVAPKWPKARARSENSVFKNEVMTAASAVLGTRSVYVSKSDDGGFPLFVSRVDGYGGASSSIAMDEVYSVMRDDAHTEEIGVGKPSAQSDTLSAFLFREAKKKARGLVGTLWDKVAANFDQAREIAHAIGAVLPEDSSDSYVCLDYQAFAGYVSGASVAGVAVVLLVVIALVAGSQVRLDRGAGGEVVASVTIRPDSKTGRVLSAWLNWQEQRRVRAAAAAAASAALAASRAASVAVSSAAGDSGSTPPPPPLAITSSSPVAVVSPQVSGTGSPCNPPSNGLPPQRPVPGLYPNPGFGSAFPPSAPSGESSRSDGSAASAPEAQV